VVRTTRPDPRPPASPPAVWAAFVAQNAWKSWTIVGLLTVLVLLCIALVRLASRPPEFVMVDANGRTTPVRRSVATDALLKFLADRDAAAGGHDRAVHAGFPAPRARPQLEHGRGELARRARDDGARAA
jgi:hypothetical protein